MNGAMMRRLSAAAASLALALSASAQMRLAAPAAPIAPIGAISAPLTPFRSFTPAAPSLSPLAPLPAPRAPFVAAPASVSEGRRFFDGAARAVEGTPSPAPAKPARGETVSFNGIALPARAFSDKTSIAGHLIRAIDAARVSIDIAIHGLALREVAAALLRAKNRGVAVRIVMNQSHIFPEKPRDARTPEVQMLLERGFDMKMLRGGDQHGVMHNKIAIFDGRVLETGSFNWTHAADAWHWENAMFHAEQARVKAYQSYWGWMWSIAAAVPDRAPAPYEAPQDGSHPVLPPAPQDPARPVLFNGEAFPAEAFSPGGVTAHLTRAIDAARRSIGLANFSFTSEDLRDALLRAKERGVSVSVVFDADQYRFLPEMHWFVENGFDVRLSRGKDGAKGVMHNKFAVFDGALVEAGSFNWTRNGERNNYENAMFLDAPDDAADFSRYFARLRAQAWAPAPDDHLGPQSAPEGFSHPDF